MKCSRVLIPVLLVGALAAPAFAKTTVEVVKMKDKSLLATFDEQINVCTFGINSAIDVQWNNSITRADGVTVQSAIFVNLHYVDSCTGSDLTMSGFAIVPGGIGSVSGDVNQDLTKGHATAVVPVQTDPDNPNLQPPLTATVTLSLNWVGSGAITKIKNTSKSRDGAVTTINSFYVNSRPGVANGTATAILPLNDPNHPGTIKPTFVNLIGTPSLSAQLGRDGNGTITIIRKTK